MFWLIQLIFVWLKRHVEWFVLIKRCALHLALFFVAEVATELSLQQCCIVFTCLLSVHIFYGSSIKHVKDFLSSHTTLQAAVELLSNVLS